MWGAVAQLWENIPGLMASDTQFKLKQYLLSIYCVFSIMLDFHYFIESSQKPCEVGLVPLRHSKR